MLDACKGMGVNRFAWGSLVLVRSPLSRRVKSQCGEAPGSKGYSIVARMAQNKTVPTKSSVAGFIDAIPDADRRADAQALIRMMRDVAGEDAKMWGSAIIGFGSYHYRYESGREGDMPLISFSPRKAATVLYNATQGSDAQALLARLGKYTTGKGCLYIKKLADVDRDVLKAMMAASLAAVRSRHEA